MPYRPTPIAPGEIYHVFNRSIARQPIFLQQMDYQRMMELIHFYRYLRPAVRFSHYNRLSMEKRNEFLQLREITGIIYIEILAFCLMRNHMHFLIKETGEKGIITFLSNIQNGYAKYFNTKYGRTGALFQEMFKAIRIETNEQLIHVDRYIHLNPHTGYVIKDLSDVESYPWSSLPDYLYENPKSIISTDLILHQFTSRQAFKEFTYDQADYQRQLDTIKHLLIEFD